MIKFPVLFFLCRKKRNDVRSVQKKGETRTKTAQNMKKRSKRFEENVEKHRYISADISSE